MGEQIRGKWSLDRLIDVGGMAAVYEAVHRNGKRVAIKVLHKIYADNDQAKERFLREGYVANKVGHPGSVQVLDDDSTDDGTPFLVMELLEGHSLEGRLSERKTLPVPGVLYIADQVLDVLNAAHSKGIIHRDIKPPNIFLTSAGEAKVLDFGLARVREKAGLSRTRTGMVIGTASYMPPEQARGRHELVDHRTDLWALAATMFKSLTGRYVHDGATQNERLIKAMAQKARSLAEVSPEIPAPVVALVDKGLEFQKVDRWADAKEMQSALRRAYEEVEHQPIPSIQRLSRVDVGGIPAPPPSSRDDELSDIHVSVVIDSGDAESQSIIVEFEDNQGKPKEKVELRRKTETPPSSADEISEVSVVEYQAHDSPKKDQV